MRASTDVMRDSGARRLHAAPNTSNETSAPAEAVRTFGLIVSPREESAAARRRGPWRRGTPRIHVAHTTAVRALPPACRRRRQAWRRPPAEGEGRGGSAAAAVGRGARGGPFRGGARAAEAGARRLFHRPADAILDVPHVRQHQR